MKRICHILAVACFAPAIGQAEPVFVQSGEHANFTRLVTQRQANDWTVTQSGREVVLTYPGFDQGFDTSRIFDFIPRDRIADVKASANSMTLTLSCDCVIGTFLERDAFVVIDVAATRADLQVPALSPSSDDAPGKDDVAPAAVKPQRPPNRTIPPLFATTEQLSPEEIEILSDIGTRLAAEVTTAADRGLLNVDPNALPDTPPKPQIDTRVFYENEDQQTTALPPALSPGANLRITTSRDLPGTFRDLTEIVSGSGNACPADTSLAISDWGNEEPFHVQIAQARQGLYGEFDRIDPQIALRLARTYLFFGFGAEARETLRIAPSLKDQADPLRMMALILDGETLPQPNVFSNLGGCEGTVALWALLALPDPPSGSLPDTDAGLRILNALPAHLRQILAPRLSGVLRAYGDPDGAAAALRNLNRLPDALPTAAKLAQAAINIDEGDTKAGTQHLREVAKGNDPKSPQALIALVDAQVAADVPIGGEVAGLIAAYAQEHRDGELGPALRRANVLALIDAGQFERAFALADKDPQLRQHMLRKLTQNADDVTFLEHSFDIPDATILAMPRMDVVKIAARQLDLGFAARAEATLSQSSDRPLSVPRQILAARIALNMGKPFKATAALLDVKDQAADPLRADAKRMSGAHDEAHRLYAQTNQPQNATETAWLSENWQNLTPADAPVFGPIARLAAPAEATSQSTDGMLARSARILAQTTETREAIQALLKSQELGPEEPVQ